MGDVTFPAISVAERPRRRTSSHRGEPRHGRPPVHRASRRDRVESLRPAHQPHRPATHASTGRSRGRSSAASSRASRLRWCSAARCAAPGRPAGWPGSPTRPSSRRPARVGLRRLRGPARRPRSASNGPDWWLWRDGCPGGESPEEVERAAGSGAGAVRRVDGDVLAFAHGHSLRVLTARWLGLPVATGAHFKLAAAAVSVLGHERVDADDRPLERLTARVTVVMADFGRAPLTRGGVSNVASRA